MIDGKIFFSFCPRFFFVEEVFWGLEDEGGGEAGNGPDATSTSPPLSSQQAEYVIHGSPLWLIAGIALVLVMFVSPADWGFWLTLVAFALPVFGFFEYMKTVTVSWNQDQRHVEVFEGVRNSEERWLMLAYTPEQGDQITIESKPVSKGDPLGSRDYWLVVKRKDGTHVASSEDAENTHYFAKRIKQCIEQFQ